MATRKRTTKAKTDEQLKEATAEAVESKNAGQGERPPSDADESVVGLSDEGSDSSAVESVDDKEAVEAPVASAEDSDSPAPEKTTSVLEKPPAPLEVIKQPEDLEVAPAIRKSDVEYQRRLLNVNPAYEQQVNNDLQTLSAILHIIHVKVAPILRKQSLSSVPASNLECLHRYLRRSRVTSGTSVKLRFPTVNVIVETSSADSNKRTLIDNFVYNEDTLHPEPVATVLAKLKFYEGDKLKVQTVNAIAPVKQYGLKNNSEKTVGYWVLESLEEV